MVTWKKDNDMGKRYEGSVGETLFNESKRRTKKYTSDKQRNKSRNEEARAYLKKNG